MRKQMNPLSIKWQLLHDWTRARPVGFDQEPGLIRFMRDDEIVYIGMESVSLSNFVRFSRAKGSSNGHAGGRLVYENRHDLTLEYAMLDVPRHELQSIRDALREEFQPVFNFREPVFR